MEPILRSVREAHDEAILWVCVVCKLSEMAFIQPRCVRCLELMEAAKK